MDHWVYTCRCMNRPYTFTVLEMGVLEDNPPLYQLCILKNELLLKIIIERSAIKIIIEISKIKKELSTIKNHAKNTMKNDNIDGIQYRHC